MASKLPRFPGRIGVEFARFFYALFFLLHEWTTFHLQLPIIPAKTADPIEPGGALKSVPFDKMALFLHRIWTNIFKKTGKKVSSPVLKVPSIGWEPPRNDPEMVTFPCPFKEFRGKHGRGLGLQYDPDLKYLTEIIFNLNNELTKYGIVWIDIKPPAEEPVVPTDSLATMEPAKEPADPGDPRTLVKPGRHLPNPMEFLKAAGFTWLEVEILKDLGNAVKRLNSSQVKCIGTHDNFREAIADIEKEFRDLEEHRQALVEKLQNNEEFHYNLYKMKGFIEEALRKSKGNRRDYEIAYSTLSREVSSNPTLNAAFHECQSQPEIIWDNERIRNLAIKSEKGWSLTRYLCAIDSLKRDVSLRKLTPRSKNLHDDWQNIVSELKRCSFTGFCQDIHEIFEGETQNIKPAVRHYLIKQLETLPTWDKIA